MLITQVAGLTQARAQVYAQAFNLPLADFIAKVSRLHVMTLRSDWDCWCKIGEIVLPRGSAVFCDDQNIPKLTDVGWPIWRSFAPLAHGSYPVTPGDPIGALHIMSNKYPWPSEATVSRSFLGKAWHWITRD